MSVSFSSWHGVPNEGIRVFQNNRNLSSTTVTCLYCSPSVKIKSCTLHEISTCMCVKITDALCLRFFPCVCGKDSNTPNGSYMADDAITQDDRSGISGLNLWPQYLHHHDH